MSITTPIDPATEFPKVEKMLYTLAWRTANTYPVSFEEARSEACYAFMRACQDYKSERGQKFSSWAYYWAWTKLKDLVIARSKDPLTFIEIEEDLLGEAPPERAESLDLLEELSEDAREIVEMILETPEELIGVVMTPRRLLHRVKDYMVARKGKSRNQVNLAVDEITIKFRQAWRQVTVA